MTVKYPDIRVKLIGRDGNAFAILGTCTSAMKRAGLPRTEIDEFIKQAMSGSYQDLLVTCLEWFEID